MAVFGWRTWVGVAVAVQAVSAAADSAAPRYRDVDLAGAVGTSATPVAVNDDGVVAVTGFENGLPFSALYIAEAGTVLRPFAAGDRIQALSQDGAAAGTNVTGGSWLLVEGARTLVPLGQALGVNDRGQVVGFMGGFFPRAALFDAATGTVTELGTLGGRQSVARSINDAGQVAGAANTATGEIHAFRWVAGAMDDLGTLAGTGDSFGTAIDERGRVVGTSAVSASAAHAFLFDEGGMHDLGTLPGCARSNATALNGHGTIVGFADLCASGGERAFVISHGVMYDLNDLVATSADGFVYASATGVNEDGTIVGIATAPGGFVRRPFLVVRGDGEE